MTWNSEFKIQIQESPLKKFYFAITISRVSEIIALLR